MDLLGSSAIPAASQGWDAPKAFPQAPAPSWHSPRRWDGGGTGPGTLWELSLGGSAELLEKEREEAAPGCPGMVSVPSSLIQLPFGSGWERGCWSLLERHICSLATGSKAAKPRQGLRRAARYPSRAGCSRQTSPPVPREASKGSNHPLLAAPSLPQPGRAKPGLAGAGRD